MTSKVPSPSRIIVYNFAVEYHVCADIWFLKDFILFTRELIEKVATEKVKADSAFLLLTIFRRRK